MSPDRSRWVPCKNGYLLPALVLSKRFRRKLLDRIKQMYREDTLELGGSLVPLQDPDVFQHLIDTLYSVDWVVYLKRSFPAVHNVVEYLARYTHHIAISNYRLVGLKNDRVYFTYRDYADQNMREVMSLEAVELIRRFLLHVVPKRFVRIRYSGLLSNRTRTRNIELCRELLNVDAEEMPEPAGSEGYVELLRRLTGVDLAVCPKCDGPMVRSETIRPGRCIRAPCETA